MTFKKIGGIWFLRVSHYQFMFCRTRALTLRQKYPRICKLDLRDDFGRGWLYMDKEIDARIEQQLARAGFKMPSYLGGKHDVAQQSVVADGER
jgi:hypothetical protein